MTLRLRWLTSCLVFVGCQSMPPSAVAPAVPESTADVRPAPAPAGVVRASYQSADFDGNNVATSAALLPLAADALERGDINLACNHLEQYLSLRPDSLLVRVHYAELLLRTGRSRDAIVQLERFDADAQDQDDRIDLRHRIRCHSRLMEVAEGQGDPYREHLHRGIGLYLLARQGEGDAAGGKLSTEGLLCKAAGELTIAHRSRPDEARPCWYLARVWDRLGQQQPAQKWLRKADDAAPFSYLTPAEGRAVQTACLRLDARPLGRR